ncbi:MAG: TlpA family protein disulfide reductase [Candidatus Promineifilaceae bacterium]
MKPRNLVVLVSAVLLFVTAASFLVLIQGWQKDAPSVIGTTDFPQATPAIIEIDPYRDWAQIGEAAPDFTLSDADGKPVTLSEFQGQPVMVNFWATWCAPCEVEMPELQAMHEKYQDDGFVILALNQDESAESVATYFNDRNLTFTALLDTNSVVTASYGAFGTLPSSYFIDRDGVITDRHIGLVSSEQLETYLAEILSMPTAE